MIFNETGLSEEEIQRQKEREEARIADEVTADNAAVVAHIFATVPQIAKAEGLANGYRVVSNCGEDAGQTVQHLHFHILGGKKLALEMA